MNQSESDKSTVPGKDAHDHAALGEAAAELSQDELAGLNGGTFIDDLIDAIKNR